MPGNPQMDGAQRTASALPLVLPRPTWSADSSQDRSEAALLVYRSNLLGGDLAVTNFGGGNTSAKIEEADPVTGEKATVLWVKGSGGDLGTIGETGFARLWLARLARLEERFAGPADEDALVGLYPYCAAGPGGPDPSIDTPLHAFLPFAHVDHVHPDAVIALAASSGGEAAVAEIFAGEVGWTPWLRPGMELALRLRDLVRRNDRLKGVVMAGHGLISWGATSHDCYANTLEIIRRAGEWLNLRLDGRPAFGGSVRATPSARERAARAADLAPRLRLQAGEAPRRIIHFDDAPEVREFVDSADLERLAATGSSCPDHFLRTKIRPLALDPKALDGPDYLTGAFAAYRADYQAYYERCRAPDGPAMRDASPAVVLVPGLGLFTLGASAAAARIAGEFYRNAINVMRGAEAIGAYQGLAEKDAFSIEYWALEEAKLLRLPPAPPLAGRIALITGAAGGIGRACAARLLTEGACVVLADIDEPALAAAGDELAAEFGADRLRTCAMDVTSEDQVAAGLALTARTYGGLDILVANAGIASAAPIEQTTLELWRRNHSVLVEGYFLAARAAFPMLRMFGGSIVFVGSKNALVASPNASAYGSAKAAALHLARCLALEGAADGVRVNVVNPDAVIRGSRIWQGDWRAERASAHGVAPGEELEAHYRERSLLKREVLPEDVAEAVLFLASERAAKSTGNILNVDAGAAAAFPR